MGDAELRLPPFADELLEPRRKADVIRVLRGLGIPSRIRAAHLQRWGEFVGVELTDEDFRAVRGGFEGL